jgi:excisionase family DNA binding protein
MSDSTMGPGKAEATRSPQDPPEPEFLTVEELSSLLRVDRKTTYAAIARGELPGVRRIGRVVRIHRATVLEWLATGQGRGLRSRRS